MGKKGVSSEQRMKHVIRGLVENISFTVGTSAGNISSLGLRQTFLGKNPMNFHENVKKKKNENVHIKYFNVQFVKHARHHEGSMFFVYYFCGAKLSNSLPLTLFFFFQPEQLPSYAVRRKEQISKNSISSHYSPPVCLGIPHNVQLLYQFLGHGKCCKICKYLETQINSRFMVCSNALIVAVCPRLIA
ncbi:hypothetical protein POVCU2_0018260 [Plasmodium ovale curtisi]|uniref:Uncharacterized protein n=1 Tax=Plasmodium ovale curtisi TaxID=864141 RepID=A0A1A8XEI1_PLAOA|nr:hypothetical protein POVCU2_0018260 [Plasmodium ovale curtisi]SBT02750.1 hypothetical protein POVCU1_080370 [Plasmodium ovale curtisi]